MSKHKNLKFEGIGPNEEVLKVIHRSWFNIASQYFIVLVAVSFFVGSFMFYPLLFPQFGGSSYSALFLFIINTFALATWIYCFLIWIDYYFDIWIITTEKIINIEQKGLFVRKVSEIKYEKIQDVSVEVTGMLETVINFGDVFVQTAADTDNINFRKISDPYAVKNLIVSLQKKKESEKPATPNK